MDYLERWLSKRSTSNSSRLSALDFNALAAVFHQTRDITIKATNVYLFTDSVDAETVEPIRELLSVNCCDRQRVHIIELEQSNDNLLTLGEHSYGGIARFCSSDPKHFDSFTKQPKLKSLTQTQSNGSETEISLLQKF